MRSHLLRESPISTTYKTKRHLPTTFRPNESLFIEGGPAWAERLIQRRMGLRLKTIAIVSCIFVGIVACIQVIFSEHLLKQVKAFEFEVARKNLERVNQGFIAIEGASLDRVLDWGHWDETENFLLGKNADYIEANLTYTALEAFETEHFLFLKGDGKIHHAGELSYERKKIVPLEAQKANEILRQKQISSFLRNPTDEGLAGLILVSGMPVFVAVSTVTDNYQSKKHSGYLIFTKTFSETLQEQIRKQSQLPLTFTATNVPDSSVKQNNGSPELVTSQAKPGGMSVVGSIPGLGGNQVLSVQFSQSREIFDRAMKARSSLLWMMGFLLLVANVAVLLLLDKFLLRPLSILTRNMETISKTSDLTLLVESQGNDEIGRLAKVFNGLLKTLNSSYSRLFEAKRVAQQANESKSRFIALVSHELRTPIQSVMGMLRMLKKQEISESKLAFIEMANDSVRGLNDTINEILDFAKFQAGKLPLEKRPFHLRQVLRSCLRNADTRRVSEPRPIELLYDIAPNVPDLLTGDSRRLSQVLINLLANAFKFTRAGEVELRVAIGSESNEALIPIIFTVRDTGIGISPRQLPHVFTPFYQVRAAASSALPGTGLGLTIVQQIVTQQGGTISVSSLPEEGTTFTVTIPFERGPLLNEGRQSTCPIGRRLALVGGASRSGRFVSASLSHYGHSVEHVELSESPKWEEQLSRVDGVVIMGDASKDIPVVKQIMSVVTDVSLPLIVVADSADILVREELTSLGVSSFIPMPASAEDIVREIDKFMVELPPGLAERRDTSAPTSRRLNVLLAEDTPTNAFILRSLLEDIGHHVEVVTNGLELLDRLRPIASGNSATSPIDLVITDIQMPLMDGDVATKRIRLIEECSGNERHLPIIAVTARALPDEVEHIKLSGVDEVLTKPVSEQDLERVIHAYMGTSSHQASAYKPDRAIGNTLRSLVSELSLDDSPPLVGHQDVGHLINIEELFARSGMSLQNTRRILESFLISFGDIRSVLEHSVEMGDNRATLRGLHSLRGLLLDVGARSATSIVEEREERWRGMAEHSISSDELMQLFAALEPVLSLTQRLIQELPIQTEDFLQ